MGLPGFASAQVFGGLAGGEEDGDTVLREAQKAKMNVRPGKCNVGLGYGERETARTKFGALGLGLCQSVFAK
ncbi:hypothetical protein Pyn_20717 [Prunus yedoensis var. nudiflora]|uniref:Uncharacterized protein n=1 Tax=Prunus yedoensis var. nudiflora TaxID=2094558 RepID=A0A314YBR1_PRUYE|nr:hypothetical protein Pyn_20717 [Prunus yedoensis var. nudiflora]